MEVEETIDFNTKTNDSKYKKICITILKNIIMVTIDLDGLKIYLPCLIPSLLCFIGYITYKIVMLIK